MKRTGNHPGTFPQIAGHGTAHFTRHRRDFCPHEWLHGDLNHVCARCGLLVPKGRELPVKGLGEPQPQATP